MFLFYLILIFVTSLPLGCVSEHETNISLIRFKRSSSAIFSSKVKYNTQLIGSKLDKFVAKHLWNTAKYDNKNSFNYFKDNPEFTRTYFIKLHQKMYKGNILPDYKQIANQNFKTKITIVDTHISQIQNEIQQGKITKIRENNIADVYLTNERYTMTQITTDFLENNLVFKATKLIGRVEIGLDSTKKYVTHLDKPHQNGITTNKEDKEVEITRYTTELLKNIQDGINDIIKGLQIKHSKNLNKGPVLLNENHPDFIELQKIALQKCTNIRKRRSSPLGGSSCAITIKPNGDVNSISPKEFLDAYKTADEYGKKILADVALTHKDKIHFEHSDEMKKFNNLLQLEQTKSHVKAVNAIDDVLKFPKSSGSKSVSDNFIKGTAQKLKKIHRKYKISHNKAARYISANYKAAASVAHGISTASNYLGFFFTAKTIVNGIKHNDTTSLAIAGTTLAFNTLTNAVITTGTKYSKHTFKQFRKALKAGDIGKISKLAKAMNRASKVGEVAKIIGEVAGPIGIVADVGLSAWSMTKSVGRLLNATDKFGRSAAIADIVGDAIDITVTAVVTVVSIAFPPAAPFVAAIGIIISLVTQLAIALFQAQNEVDRLNAEVPLLEYEKEQVFQSRFFDWFSTRKPDYVDSLVDEKKANDIAVQLSLEILKNNIEILGIVVPSRTLFYEGSCTLTNQYCALKNLWGCTRWESEFTVGSGCDWRKPCGKNKEICDNYWTPHEHGYNEKRCKCNGKSNTLFGEPRKNSVVDFRKKQQVYWERSVPKDVENAEFKCKPGSKSYIDYKVHQENHREDFLCVNAIGLLQPSNRRQKGQAMLFALEDGDDEVYLGGDTTPSMFLMGGYGVKKFDGGGGTDDFIFDSNCTKSLRGYFYGNNGDDSISLGDSSAINNRITVDFSKGKLSSENNNLDLQFNGIENANGRKNQPETFVVSCRTTRVSGNGGSSTKFDEILIPMDLNCKHNVTVFGSSYTKMFINTIGIVTLVFDGLWAQSYVELEVYQQDKLKLGLFFINTTSSQLTNVVTTKTNDRLKVELMTSPVNKMEFNLSMAHGLDDISLRFTENTASYTDSVLFLSMKEEFPTLFFHNLPDLKGNNFSTRTGCNVTENIFEITGPLWHVIGGDLNDEFILHTDQFGFIDGKGGVDTLKFSQDFSKTVTIDLGSDNIRSIENIYGVSGVPVAIKTFCNTLVVASKGGSEDTSDLITIPKMHCDNRNLRILVEGTVHVVLEERNRNENDTVQIIANGNDGLQLELETKSNEIGNTFVVIPTSSKNWAVINAKSNDHQIVVHLKDNGTEDWIKFTLKIDKHLMDEQYLQSPYIQIFDPESDQIPGVLIFERQSGTPKLIYDLRQAKNESVAQGFSNIRNIFILATTQKPWSVSGGNLSDEFLLQVKTSEHSGQHSIVGGENDNTLILECGENSHTSNATFVVNLLKKEFGYLNPVHGKMGIIDSIQNVVGRPGAPDILHANCNTRSLNGQGGRSEGNENDLIRILDQDCDYNLLTIVPEYTTVLNNAKKGEFVYYISNLSTSSLEIQSTQHNKHLLKFLFHPWDVIKAVAFNETTQELGLKISKGENDTVHVFKLWGPPLSSEYVNPIFEFSPAGSSVSSDIRVSTDGVTMATVLVEGLKDEEIVHGLPVDVNRFLINITFSNHSSGGVHGCSDGLRCSANQIWIFNLETGLEVLDGGNCQKNNCTNYIFFPTNPTGRKLHFDLDINKGKVTTDKGEIVISQLKNIHELHGSEGISADVTCSTTQVSKLDAVMITQAGCQSDLIIGVEYYTRVIFQKIGHDDKNTTSIKQEITTTFPIIDENDSYELDDDDDDTTADFNNTLYETNLSFSNRTIHYRFARPMSFDPEGPLSEILSVDHIYYLPFELNILEKIGFNVTEKRLYYLIDGVEISHKMISPLYIWEQFYSQPSFLTDDGYSIQVARDGSLWATLGNTSNEITQESIPDLQETATDLEITIIIQSLASFYYIGHSGTNDDRNVLENVPDKIGHLAGGGANDTIYDILSLDKDVYIYTGFDEDSYIDWDGNKKQTIDLTDIVVPIRNKSGTKFVPQTTTNGNNLIIFMQGYEKYFPGKVIVVNGVFPWVAKRIQLILSGAVMDFVSDEDDASLQLAEETTTENLQSDEETTTENLQLDEETTTENLQLDEETTTENLQLDEETTTENLKVRNKRSLKVSWAISPRPLIIPGDVSIYSISTEDLEDGQDIQLESSNEEQGTFQVVRNGSDLYMTNAVSSNLTAIKAVIINDFWESNELMENVKVISGVTVRVPGLNLVLNDSSITSGDMGNFSSADKSLRVLVKPWNQALFEFEEIVLENMPDIPRTFDCEECLPWWKQTVKLLIVGVVTGIIIISVLALIGLIIVNHRKKGCYAVVAVADVNPDTTSNIEMMQLDNK